MVYVRAERFVEERIYRTELLLRPDWSRSRTHEIRMDTVYEESLELLGAGLLLAAVLAYREDASPPPGVGAGPADGEQRGAG